MNMITSEEAEELLEILSQNYTDDLVPDAPNPPIVTPHQGTDIEIPTTNTTAYPGPNLTWATKFKSTFDYVCQ
jgi:hypothetical protein